MICLIYRPDSVSLKLTPPPLPQFLGSPALWKGQFTHLSGDIYVIKAPSLSWQQIAHIFPFHLKYKHTEHSLLNLQHWDNKHRYLAILEASVDGTLSYSNIFKWKSPCRYVKPMKLYWKGLFGAQPLKVNGIVSLWPMLLTDPLF